MILSIPLKLLIALAVGAAIGLEREIHQKKDHHKNRSGELIGLRTLSMTTLLGAISGIIGLKYPSLSIILASAFCLMIIINYAISSYISKDTGVTTGLAALMSFVIGFLIAVEIVPMTIVLSLAVVIMLILAYKDKVKDIVEELHTRDLKALISYGIIAIIILPFLPNASFSLSSIPHLGPILFKYGVTLHGWGNLEIINPFRTWLIVAIITGVNYLGYVIEKMFGKGRGLYISSLIGGFVSSTATTQSLAVQSLTDKSENKYVSAALLSTFASYFSLFILILPFNLDFTAEILPIFIILIGSFGIAGWIFYQLSAKEYRLKPDSETEKAIFSIKPAIIFAALFLVVKIISSFSLQIFGNSGFYIASGLAGFAGLDAISVNIADLSKSIITIQTATYAFIIVNAINLFAKSLYIYLQGTRKFAVKYAATVTVIIAITLGWIWLV